MASKLTLYVDDKLIPKIKKYAKDRGSSVSQLVNDFFLTIQKKPDSSEAAAPVTSSLKGILKDKKIDVKEYKSYLEEKYL